MSIILMGAPSVSHCQTFITEILKDCHDENIIILVFYLNGC